MTRPLILDLCCKAGGAGKGYYEAGFDVIGWDLVRQKRYPFPMIVGDALSVDERLLRRLGVAAIHASPDCQGYTELRHAPGAKGKPQTIPQFRRMLRRLGLPYVIENVMEATWDMVDPVMLCGSMFDLGAQGHQLQRERAFETSFPMTAPRPCQHTQPVIGVYGGHARNRASKHGGRGTKDVWIGGHRAAASEALGIDWMTLDELSNAIPPAYTAHIGAQLLSHLQSERAAA